MCAPLSAVLPDGALPLPAALRVGNSGTSCIAAFTEPSSAKTAKAILKSSQQVMGQRLTTLVRKQRHTKSRQLQIY